MDFWMLDRQWFEGEEGEEIFFAIDTSAYPQPGHFAHRDDETNDTPNLPISISSELVGGQVVTSERPNYTLA